MLRLSPKSLLLLILLFSSKAILSQSGDGLDFLDKVDDIQIPKEKVETKTTPSKTTNTSKTVAKPAPKKIVAKPAPKPTVTRSTPPPTKPAPKKTPIYKPAPSPSKITTPTITEPKEEVLPAESTKQIWIDSPLAMDPDYLPGFDSTKVDITDNQVVDGGNLEAKSEKDFSHPLPVLDGNFSIWGSFVEFLSKYQKAFYIFGILLLFAIYRLKSGRSSSSSRKSTPTIRRMRR